MNQQQKDKLAEALKIPKRTQETLDSGSSHPYTCRCDTCLQWWIIMGPNGGTPGDYGPFKREELIETAKAMGYSDERIIKDLP